MNGFISDLRHAFRTLLKNPGFTLVAVVALALGIGANTAVFSVMNAVLLRPLPFPSAKRLVDVASVGKRGGEAASYPDFQDFRKRNHSFRYLAAVNDDSWTLTEPGRQAANIRIGVVSADLFAMLGMHPLMGRVFRPDEDENTSGPMTVVIGANAWRKQFAGDPAIIGRAITLRGLPYTVVGVMLPEFNFPVRNTPFDAWTTFGFSGDLSSPQSIGVQRGAHYLAMVGELKPGATPASATADLLAIADALAKDYPANQPRTVRVSPLLDRLVHELRPVLLLLLGAVCCVLLVACANVANLLLARASTRHRELAIRAALGAGKFRVIRQALTESVVLSLFGGTAGLFLGVWGNELLVRFSPVDIPRLSEAQFDGAVFLFTLGVSLLTGIVFGIAPAWRASQSDPAESLKEGARGATEGIRTNKARSLLIVAEVALAVMLLACAGLLIRSLDRLNQVDPGFNSRNVLSAQISLPGATYSNSKAVQTFELLNARLRALPGVVAAANVSVLPLGGNGMNSGFEIEDHPVAKSERLVTRFTVADSSYLHAMGIPLLSGRNFNESDTADSTPVVLVNKTFAEQNFPGVNPIGKRIDTGIGEDTKDKWRLIVGVVGSVDEDRIGQEPLPEVFAPLHQFPSHSSVVVIKTRGNPRGLVPALRSLLHGIDPNVPLDEIHTMDELVSKSLSPPRFLSFLLAIFAGVALVLTAVGLYGVIAYSVSQRTREIGTRMALGAQQNRVLKLVVGQGMVLTATGVAIGLAGALAIGRLLQSVLFEVAPTDPLALGIVAVLVFAVALLASFVPAARAANIDPMVALRYE